jgi:hypothetical protein
MDLHGPLMDSFNFIVYEATDRTKLKVIFSQYREQPVDALWEY